MQRRIIASLFIAAVLLLAWIAAGPFMAAREIRNAVIDNDVVALDEHIDFPAVRDSLKGQLFGLVDGPGATNSSNNESGGSGFGNALKALMGTALDVALTPQMVLELLRHKTALGQDRHDDAPAQPNSSAPRRKPVIHYGFVSPNRFNVTVADMDAPDFPATLVLRRYGMEWKLAAIELPLREHPEAP
jgi:hypothetical protein